MDPIRSQLDALAELLVLGREEDASLLLECHKRLRELGQASLEGGNVPVAEAVRALLRVVNAGDCEHPESTVRLVASAVTGLQRLHAGAKSADLPPEWSLAADAAAPLGPVPSPVPEQVDTELAPSFVIEAREHLENADASLLKLDAAPGDAESLNAVFRAFHSIKGGAACLEFGEIKALAHETETLLDLARKGDLVLSGLPMDVTFESVDAMKKLVDGIADFLKTGRRPSPTAEIGVLVPRIRRAASGNAATPPAPPPARMPSPSSPRTPERPTVPPLLPVPAEQPRLSSPVPETAPGATSPTPTPPPAPASGEPVREMVRVDAERLDHLIDLIGELVIAESMVSQSAELRTRAGGVLSKQVGQLDKITRELQEMGMSLRMVPLRPVFQKMARAVRDLSKKMGKPVEYVTVGEDIEVDKAIVDRIVDPLLHIVRNSLDHGLEAGPEARVQAGKPSVGRIEVRAFHREGSLFIEVEDDGRGLDREAILAKGIEKGLLRKGDALSDREIYNLIFLPGFSTAKAVTDVSGRGVGMDVVRRNLEALRGHIELQTRKGQGTVVSMRLPLTLAIIEGMVLRIGAERYIVPTLSVTRLIRPGDTQRSTVLARGELLSIQGDLIPMFRLDRLLSVDGAARSAGQGVVVIIEHEGTRAGLLADEVLGQQQIVIKSLGDAMERVPGVSGGAILPDGQVGLILDVSSLLHLAHSAVQPEPAAA